MRRLRQEDLPFRGSSHQFVGADHGTGISVFLFHGGPGSGPGPHRHPYDEVQFIQSGRGRWVVDGESFEAGAGDVLVIHAGEVHSFRCLGDGPLVQVDVHLSPTFVQENLPAVPGELRTARLVLRPWRADDAPRVAPVLEANAAHLGPWIPAQVVAPAPVPALAERLAGFAADFAADRAYRYAIVDAADGRHLGEADLFPRAATGRVPLARADRVEIGYWLDAGATGRGLATEAARALVDVAAGLRGVAHVEIRCEAANAASAAVPRRLGFQLVEERDGGQVWRLPLGAAERGAT